MLQKPKTDYMFLQEFVDNDYITDINYNGQTLWIDHIIKGRYSPNTNISSSDLDKFCYRIANQTNNQFNNSYPILENEIDDLRISIIHRSIAKSGHSISIRKTPPIVRLKKLDLIKSNYAPEELLDFFEKIMLKKTNIMVSGQPGVGKTEFVKYLTNFISPSDRVITIEDTLEIKYPQIQPFKDGISLKVNNSISYRDAIKASLRQRPNYILLSEVRGIEVVELMQATSTGSKMISTIHAPSAFVIPERMLHMMPGLEISNEKLLNYLFTILEIGVHLDLLIDDQGIHRYIREVCIYTLHNSKRETVTVYTSDDGMVSSVVDDFLGRGGDSTVHNS